MPEDPKRRLGRRLIALHVASLGVAVPAAAQGPKSGFRSPAPSGASDSDPSDPPGRGRGEDRGGAPRSGVSDSDPSDPPGQGRGEGRGGAPRSGVSDSDPSDPPGEGRGAQPPAQGISDSDPSDPPGQGRGARPPDKAA